MSLRPTEVDFKARWAKIKKTVLTVLSLKNIKRSEWNDRFSDVYTLCIATPKSFSDYVYVETEKLLLQHVGKLYKAISASDDLLVAYHKSWFEVSQGISYLNFLYTHANTIIRKETEKEIEKPESERMFRRYLNAHHLRITLGDATDPPYGGYTAEGPLLEIEALGLHICKKKLIEPLQSKLVHLLLDGIRLDREGVCPNQSVFQGVILSFVQVEEYKQNKDLELYQQVFETPFLNATDEFYQLEVSGLLQENDCSQYMEKVIQKLREEDLRSRKYLHPSSYSKVTQVCGQRMISDQLRFLLSECRRMVEEENEKDLKNLYFLLNSISTAFEALIRELQQFMTKKGLEVISALKGDNVPKTFVESFLAFRDKYSTLIKTVFSGDQRFVAALDKACIAVINHTENPKQVCQSSELLAKYCDSLLKKNSKACSENEVESKLTWTIILFRYLADKDLFQNFYSRMLAKRLIHKLSMSMDAEESMINKMKQVCGNEYTAKLHRMFNDINISADLNSNFSESLCNRDVEIDINFSISVLQAGAWPLAQAAISTFAIPQQLEKSVQEFEMFYNEKFSGRKLHWLHHLCSAELKLCYLKKPYIGTMGTYQMAILLLYQKADVLSFEEISANTKLGDEQLAKQMKSLLESKLLLATDSVKPIKAGSAYRLNKAYSNKRLKFKLLAVAPKETAQEEVKQTHASVDADRNAYLQAAIVRIMKGRKILYHNSLIEEVINQAKDRFVPNVSMIKKCIEFLIDKDYISRTDATNEYSYVA